METIREGGVMTSQLKKDEIRKYIDQLLGMVSEKAESIHLHKKDFEIVQASPASFGLSLSNSKDIVSVRKGRTIVVRAVE